MEFTSQLCVTLYKRWKITCTSRSQVGFRSTIELYGNLHDGSKISKRHHDNSVFNILFPIEGTVSALHGPLEIIIPSYQTMLHDIQKDFPSPTCSKDATTQTAIPNNGRSSETNEVQVHNDHHPLRIIRRSNQPSNRPEYDPARVGVRDLDPFGEGSGMIFDPFNTRHLIGRSPGGLGVPGVLPPGAIPPGARFDPFGPPELNPSRPHRRRPDDDHLPPPGYNDMFQ